MPAYRLRAHLRFAPGNGMAAWALAQNDVRLGMAYHLNAGRADEERSRHDAAGDVYACDLIFPDQALAQDTWNTLIAVCVDGYLRPAADERSVSWMDLHECQHEGAPEPCPAPTQQWRQVASSAPTVDPWVQPVGAHDAYPAGAVVTHNGQTWTSTIDGNVWAPGTAGLWTVT